MIRDYKNYRARPQFNQDRFIQVCLAIVIIIALCVRLPEVGAEQTSQVVTECDGLPTMEMGMPIDMERVRT